jgi:putative flippase GtrA
MGGWGKSRIFLRIEIEMKLKAQQLFFCTLTTVLWCVFMLLFINEYSTANILGVLTGAIVMFILSLFIVKKFHYFEK